MILERAVHVILERAVHVPYRPLNLNGGIALVVGNEGEGLRSLVRKNCDEIMRLPQYGQIDSLNAAVAGSIALYLARNARV